MRTIGIASLVAFACIILQLMMIAIGPVTLLFQALLMTLIVLSTAALGDENGRFDIRQPWAVLMLFHLPFWVVGTLYTIIQKGQGSEWKFDNSNNMQAALFIVSIGFLFIGIGYRWSQKVCHYPIKSTVVYRWDLTRLIPITIILYFVIWMTRYTYDEYLRDATFSMLINQNPMPTFARTLTGQAPLLLLLLIWSAYYCNKDRKDVLFLAISITIGELAWAMMIGTSKSLFILPLFMPIIPYVIFKKRVPIRRFMASVFLLVFIAYPYTSELRDVYFQLDGPSRTEAREIAFEQSIPRPSFNNEAIGDYASQAMERFSGINALVEILKLDEQGKLDIAGEFYWRAVAGLVPRLIWPDKPILLEGVYFSAYLQGWSGSISDLDPAVNAGLISGSVALTLFGSFYWNFGWIGVVASSLALGFFSGWVFLFLKRRNNLSDPSSFLYYVTIVSLMDTTETEVVKFPSSVVLGVIMVWVVVRALGWHKLDLKSGASAN